MTDDRTVGNREIIDAAKAPQRRARVPLGWTLAIVALALFAYVARGFVLLLLVSATLAYVVNPMVKVVESALIKRDNAGGITSFLRP